MENINLENVHKKLPESIKEYVELKVTELKKEHTGQIMTYMNYIDKNIKTYENYTKKRHL